ncbi:MAG: hypothetical protein LBF12_06270 [Christensenellaceae bacterium]|jgi:DNA polymerase-3 subunit delta'|nr:hypothetical protein [Christensenellaceae bacterium]
MIGELIKNSKIISEFTKDFYSERLSHAYIISGEDLHTRKIVMSIIARLLFCKNSGCGECSICARVDTMSHPDFKVLNSDGKISVSEIEELIDDTALMGWESARKVYYIDNSDTLNALRQNKLLKIFEEPPKGVIIFLFTNDESSLLQTITSRAKKLYLPRFTSKIILDELLEMGIEYSVAKSCAVFSDGRFDKAFKFSEETQYTEIYDEAFDMLLKCDSSKNMINMVDSKLFERENIELTFEFFEIIMRDVLEYVSNGTNYITLDRLDDIKKLAVGFERAPGVVAKCIFSIVDMKQLIHLNVTPFSLAEKVIHNILQEKFKCR